MNLFATLLGYGLSLLPSIVLGIQTVQGDAAAGLSKQQTAKDALQIALQGAAAALPAGSTNGALAQASGIVAGQVIDASSAIAAVFAHIQKHDSITTAVNFTRSTGAYQAATAEAKASLQGPAGITAQVAA